MFDVEPSNQARKFLKGTHKILSERITEKVESLRIEPFPSDAIRVVGAAEKQFRVRVGK
jgi:mRNA-degrading endonuclease RelE of RelBE toxin-antitoxin system